MVNKYNELDLLQKGLVAVLFTGMAELFRQVEVDNRTRRIPALRDKEYKIALENIDEVIAKAKDASKGGKAAAKLTLFEEVALEDAFREGKIYFDLKTIGKVTQAELEIVRSAAQVAKSTIGVRLHLIERGLIAERLVFGAVGTLAAFVDGMLLYELLSSGNPQPVFMDAAVNPLLLLEMDEKKACAEMSAHPETVGKAVVMFGAGAHPLYEKLRNEIVADRRVAEDGLKVMRSGHAAESDATRVVHPRVVSAGKI